MRRFYQAVGLLALALLGLSLFILIRSFHAGFGWATVAGLVFLLRIFPWPRRKQPSIWDML